MGQQGQNVPEMSDEWVETISNKYIELYEKLTGHAFEPMQLDDEQVYQQIVSALAQDAHR
jgi:phosphoribosylaminoimidazole-succinocarboxamide synthase